MEKQPKTVDEQLEDWLGAAERRIVRSLKVRAHWRTLTREAQRIEADLRRLYMLKEMYATMRANFSAQRVRKT